MKTIEMVKGPDGVYRQGKTKVEPKPANVRSDRSRRLETPKEKQLRAAKLAYDVAWRGASQIVNDALEEMGVEALNVLTRGFFKNFKK